MPIPWHQIQDPFGLFRHIAGSVNVRQFRARVDGVADDAAAINEAITAAASTKSSVVIPGDVKVGSTIVMASGVRVVANGRIIAGTQSTIVSFSGVNDASWEGGEIVGDGVTDGQSGIVLTNALRNVIRGVSVTNTLNKGIDINGTSADNHIYPVKVTGCTGTYGGGLSMYGANVTRNTLHGGYFTGNRAGVTLNGGTYNTVIDVNASGNRITGLMLDGVDSDTGDGAKYCTILGGTFNGNLDNAAPQHYAGLYLGNGASYNRIIGVTAKGNTSAGIRTSANHGIDEFGNPLVPPLVNNANVGNLIEGATVEGNGDGGIVLSGAPRTRIVSPLARANTGHGINIYRSDDVTVEGGESTDNTVAGIYIQSARSRVSGTRIRSNATGYHSAWIGALASDPAWVPSGNIATSIENGGNSVADYNIAAGLGRVENSSGVISDTVYEQGDASYSFQTGTSTVRIIRISVPLTADRTTQLDNLRARAGDTIRVVRSSAATGAFVHTVTAQVFGTLRRLVAPGQWVEATHDGTQWVVSGFGYETPRLVPLTYGATIDWDASRSNSFALTPSDGNAFTINAPASPAVGQTLSLRINNNTGGALGAITWPATFKMATWTSPATGFNRTLTVTYDGSNWYQASTPLDVPN